MRRCLSQVLLERFWWDLCTFFSQKLILDVKVTLDLAKQILMFHASRSFEVTQKIRNRRDICNFEYIVSTCRFQVVIPTLITRSL